MFSLFSVGQEYSGYYMDGKYRNRYGCWQLALPRFDDTRPGQHRTPGRPHMTAGLGDMIRGRRQA